MTIERMQELLDEQMRTGKSILQLLTKVERLRLFSKESEGSTNKVAHND